MNRKQNSEPGKEGGYRMNYYPAQLPAGYAVSADKPGLYAASPYALPSPYGAGQPGLPTAAGLQAYSPAQQYAMVSQASPYSPHATAYYASPSTAYAGSVPLSSLQAMQQSQQQVGSAYLSAYPSAAAMSMHQQQRAALMQSGYGGSPLYATTTYSGLTQGVPQPGAPQGSRPPQYGMAPVGFAPVTQSSPQPGTPPGVYLAGAGYGPPY